MRLYRITNVEVVRHPVVALTYDDGFIGEVDFTGTIARGDVTEPMRDPEFFATVRIGEQGRSLDWGDPEGSDLDFCADALRFKAEEQVVRERAKRFAAAHRSAAE